jgi:hypothetical protein
MCSLSLSFRASCHKLRLMNITHTRLLCFLAAGDKWHVIAPSGCTLRDEPDGRPQQHLDFGTVLEVESKLEHEAGVFISQPSRGWIVLHEDDVKGGIGIAPGDERCAAQWRYAQQRYCVCMNVVQFAVSLALCLLYCSSAIADCIL